MFLCFGEFVVAMLLSSCVHFAAAKPGVGINAERRERVGKGCRCDVGRGRHQEPAWRLAGCTDCGGRTTISLDYSSTPVSRVLPSPPPANTPEPSPTRRPCEAPKKSDPNTQSAATPQNERDN